MALLLSLFVRAPMRVGIDNAGVVRRFAALKQGRLFAKPWQLVRDGDVWRRIHDAMEAKGLPAVEVTKVRGHALVQDVASGLCTDAQRVGNDHADMCATMGIERHRVK
eukprot:1403975-Alexandrium_andersonii.AAC.1